MTIPSKRILERYFVYVCVAVIVFGGAFLYWYHFVDGITMRRVYTYRDGVNPSSLKTVKQVYHRNEMVEIENSFCKNRDARVSVQWTLANERLVFFAPSEPRQLPVGCYPEDSGFRDAPVQLIPNDAQYGEHYFVGVVTMVLPDGRIRTQNLKTEKFQVAP